MPPSSRRSRTPIPTYKEALRLFWRLVRLLRSHWVRIGTGIGLGVAGGLLGVVAPLITKMLIDTVYPSHNVGLMHVIVLGSAALGITSTLLSVIRNYYSQLVSTHITAAAGLMFFNHLQHQALKFFDERRVGEMMSRFGDVRTSLQSVSRVFEVLLVNGIYLLVVPPVLLWLNWRLALLSLASLPLTTLISAVSGRRVREHTKISTEIFADLNAIQVEIFSQIKVFKGMASERFNYERIRAQTIEGVSAQLNAAIVGIGAMIVNSVLQVSGAALFMWYSWTLILRGELSLGSFVAFSAYLGYLTGPISQIASLGLGFQRSAVTLARTFEYLDSAAEQDPSLVYGPAESAPLQMRGVVELRNVCFGYSPNLKVLDGLSLSLSPGKVTALVGPSGAGKSSLVRLIARLDRPLSGTIAYDGIDASQLQLRDVRANVAVVWQETTLLKGTVWDNLVIGAEDVPRAAVEEAMRVCQLDALLDALPEGYETSVAEWGATLSGGQRQRIAVARAIIRGAPILLLDEVTSNLDQVTETEMLSAMLPRLRRQAVLLVTHRMATAAMADEICVLSEGKIVARGRHEDLLASCDVYRGLAGAAVGQAASEVATSVAGLELSSSAPFAGVS